MARTQFVLNDSAGHMVIGGILIPPGEGREVDVTLIPASKLAQPAATPTEAAPEPSIDKVLAELLNLSIAMIVPELPMLSNEALDRLKMLEEAKEAPRKGLLSALADERLSRANDALKSDPGFGDGDGDTDGGDNGGDGTADTKD